MKIGRRKMNELYNLGLSDNTISAMIEINPMLKEMTSREIISKVNLLRKINCTDSQILSIIGSNSLYFSRTDKGIANLINYLLRRGFNTLNILFDSNPYILNLESFEIEKYIKSREDNGERIEDIIDDLDSHTYLFNVLK